MRTPLVAGNWKMNGSLASVGALLEGIKQGIAEVNCAEVAVCAPFVYLPQLQQQLQGSVIAWGAQNMSQHEKGAYTGEISAAMLQDFGCRYVIVGHSERRSYYGESDALVAEKFAAVRAAAMVPILCIGETLEEREANITNDVVTRQLEAVLEREGVAALADAVIAYEPVWAIGTGKTASPAQAQEVHASIRQRLAEQDSAVAAKIRILYGGSMNAANAAELLAQNDIDGGLIGGASLKADDFLTIARAANR
ncbi:triose-phosphate isomerase [Ectothiorhodospiraceae bacterium BW-2]|nr:triose-phosphate isomerase [Ectothiorhodospiraceae bacterium BW-2]